MALRDMYSEIILEHNKSTHNRKVPEGDPLSERGHNPNCGDDITLHLTIQDGKVIDGGYSGSGCAISQASTSILLDQIVGMTTEEAKNHLEQYFKLVKRQASKEEKRALGDAVIFENLAEMPARMKCGTLGWHCARVILESV